MDGNISATSSAFNLSSLTGVPTNHGATADTLASLEEQQLIQMVLSLSSTFKQMQEDCSKAIDLRLCNLERKFNMSQPYLRRDSVEISGIPSNILDGQIEDEVIEVFRDAKVTVNRQPIKSLRIGKGGKVIVKVVNRKFIPAALINCKNLKGSRKYGEGAKLYVHDSFTLEFSYFNYLVRTAFKGQNIFKYKVRYGVTLVQKKEGDEFVEVGYANDLKNIGILVPDRELTLEAELLFSRV